MNTPLIDQLIACLTYLPGIGPKSAQRIAFHLLQQGREKGKDLAKALQSAMDVIQYCSLCRHFTQDTLCHICQQNKRDKHIICVVEQPSDLMAIEQTAQYQGRYFVLMGHLSPIDGIGPEELGIPALIKRAKEESIQEVILATNTTIEGEATSEYIAQTMKNLSIQCTRIAHGVPIGGELEYLDGRTLSLAFKDRSPMIKQTLAEQAVRHADE
jgi:recombination protein RecR